MAEHNDQELEELFRRELGRQAEAMDVTVPVVSGARATAARRRHGQTVLGVAAAVAAVAVTGFVVARGNDSGRSAEPPVADRTSEHPTAVAEWRTEYWHGLQVDVPADWAWGAAPVGSGKDQIRCGGPDESTTPYVGRPVYQTDVCSMVEHLEIDAPYVWLGADIEPGVEELDNGYTQETVAVAGTTLTVATDDPALREMVIDSAGVGGLCQPELSKVPSGQVSTAGGEVTEPSVCAYAREGSGPYQLVAGSLLTPRDFERLETLLRDTPERPVHCKDVPEFVVVAGWYADSPDPDAWERQASVFELVCGVVDLGGGGRVRATSETVQTWRGPMYDATLRHFIGPQG